MVKGLFKNLRKRSIGRSPDASMEVDGKLPAPAAPATPTKEGPPSLVTCPSKWVVIVPEADAKTPTPEDTRTQTPEDTDTERMPSEKSAELLSHVEDPFLTASTPVTASDRGRFFAARSRINSITASSIPMLEDSVEKVKVYYVHVKDGVMQIIGSVGDRVVFINAKVCEVGSIPIAKLGAASNVAQTTAKAFIEQARGMLNDKTVWLKDGYIYTTATVEGQVVYVKAKTSAFYEVLREGTTAVSGKAVAVYDTSCARGSAAVQPLKPYYVMVQNGVVRIVAPIGNKFVVVQAKTSEIFASMQVRTLDSLTGARASIEGYTSPLVSKAVGVRNNVTGRIETYSVSIKDGIVSIRTRIGEELVDFKAKLSEAFDSISLRTSDGIMGTKKAITDFAEKVVSIVSSGYGRACDRVRLLYVSTNDGFFYVACQVNDKVVVLRMKVSEMDEYVRSKTMMVCSNAVTALTDTYNGAKMRVLNATELTKTKTQQAGANVRSIAANPTTQVTVASAAGGAMTLGATGGAAGLGIGGFVGAACAVPAAFFTFGLSIPVGAAIGAGAGLCIGSTAGGATGLVTGGAAGYNAHKHKDQIGSKAQAYKAMAAASTNKLRAQVMGAGGHANA